ncbi:MAG: hypothetical protein AAFY57_18695 [Cyanobacteria bacterium J06642_2]
MADDINTRIQQVQLELLEGDRRLQRQIEGIGNRVDSIGEKVDGLGGRIDSIAEKVDGLGERLATMAEQQARTQRQLGEVVALSSELYRVQLATQKELRDLVAVVRRNQDIINQPPQD